MADVSVEQRINFLKDEINKSNYKYYVEENPYLSDFEYDTMFAELKELEDKYPLLKTPDSPTQRVGSVSEKFFQHTHKYRLYSLDNTYNEEELKGHPNGEITYYKGLGQMSDQDLKESMFSSEWQRLEPITYSDIGMEILEDLMGKDAEPRKDFVFNNIDFSQFTIE